MTNTTPATILIVEDDPDIASALMRGLEANHYVTCHADKVAPALELAASEDVAAAIVDVMIGDESGLDLVRTLRARGIRMPVLMLSALAEVEDRSAGIEAGADDYIVKPFSFTELLARLKVQEMRAATRPAETLALLPSTLDPATKSVICGDDTVVLTQREFQLLSLLWSHRDEILSRGEIFDTLWEPGSTSSENVVDVYLGYVRKKLADVAQLDFEITTIRNKGFSLSTRTQILKS